MTDAGFDKQAMDARLGERVRAFDDAVDATAGTEAGKEVPTVMAELVRQGKLRDIQIDQHDLSVCKAAERISRLL